jgi:hypothetical protein
MIQVRSVGVAAPLVVAVALTTNANAQDGDTPLEVGRWYNTVEAGLNLTQSAYSDNWSGGDQGSVVWTAIVNAEAKSQMNETVNWRHTLKLAYGQTHNQDDVDDEPGKRRWESPEKSTDLIDYETVARFTLGGFVDPFVSGSFESQFLDASDPMNRTLILNPLEFKESAGVARKFVEHENEELISRLGFTLRENVRRIFVADVGTDTETATSLDGGIELVTDYKTRILEDRVSWTSKLGLYQPLFYSGKSDLEDIDTADAGIDPDVADLSTEIEIDWENIFTTQITSIVSVNLYARFVYDAYDNSVEAAFTDDGELADPALIRGAIRKAGQFKQTLAIGITYRFL